jgi:hypothetical protein
MSSIMVSEFLYFVFAVQVSPTPLDQQEIACIIETMVEIKNVDQNERYVSGIFRKSIEKLR